MTAGATARTSTGWLFGPVPDLLLGCGAAYLALAVVHLAVGDALPGAIPGGVLILLFSLPHYGATLVRVYGSSEGRERYRFFAIHATLALAAVFVLSTRAGLLGSLVLTVYLTWSPWHYTGQNYGIVLMLLGRRGVVVDPVTKRWIWASFVASFGLAFVAMHGAQPEAAYAPVSYADTTVRLLPLGIPSTLATGALIALAVGYAATLAGVGVRLLRAGSPGALGPAALLVLTQAVWFSLPVMLRLGGLVVQEPGPASPFSGYGFLWVAAAHAAQYLWITVYYAAREGGGGTAAFLGKAALAGFAVWIVPGLLFAPGLLGGFTYDSGLALLIAAVVNLHHFVLDGAIWKLRDGRVAQVLLRAPAAGAAPAPAPPATERPLLRWTVAVLGAASIAVAAVGFWESEFGFVRAIERGDLARAEQAVERFAWIGRDGASKRIRLGGELARQEDYARAQTQLERAIAVEPTALGHHLLGLVHEQVGRLRQALAQYEAALALEPERTATLEQRAGVLLALGRPEEAVRELDRMIERDPTNERARSLRVRARLALRDRGDGSAVE